MRLFGHIKTLLAAPRGLALVAMATLAAPSIASAQDIVLSGGAAGTRVGNWTIASDSGASTGSVVRHPDGGGGQDHDGARQPRALLRDVVRRRGRPGVPPVDSRPRQTDYWGNDSVFVQFSNSVTSSGSATYRIGTTSAAEVNLEDCDGCGLSGWKWQDNGYGSGVLGPAIYFASSGTQRIRVQTREDGLSIDQILLSPSTYLNSAPTSVVSGSGTATPPLHARHRPPPATSRSRLVRSHARRPMDHARDATAAAGPSIRHPDAGAAKLVTPLASPSNYFEMTFDAVAGKPYRLWILGKADSNYWGNDSVFVQFSNSVTTSGAATFRIGTTSAAEVNLEECSGCGLSGWKWQDNGWGRGILGPTIYFASSGHAARPRPDA